MKIKFSIFIVVILSVLASGIFAQEQVLVNEEDKLSSINLYDALITAIENSPILMSSKIDTETAKHKLSEAKTAYNPVIGASVNLIQSGPKSVYEVEGEEVQLSPTSQGIVTGNLAWIVDVNGQIKRSVKIQSDVYDASKYAFEASLADLIFNVQSSYFSCLLAKENLNTAESAMKTSVDNLKNIIAEVEEGTKPGFDQTRQEYDVTIRQNAVVNALSNYKQSINNFNFTLGYIDKSLVVPEGTSVDNIKFDVSNDLIDKAFTNRSELKQLSKLSEASKIAVSYAQGANYPSLQLTGSYSKNFISTEITGTHNWQAMANINIPIWSGGVVDKKIKQAKSEHEKSLYSIELQKQVIMTSVKNAVLDLLSLKELILTTQKGVELAKENYDIAYTRYEQQLGTYLDVSTALDQLVKAENDYISARYSYAISVFYLERQAGTQADMDAFMNLIWEDKK